MRLVSVIAMVLVAAVACKEDKKTRSKDAVPAEAASPDKTGARQDENRRGKNRKSADGGSASPSERENDNAADDEDASVGPSTNAPDAGGSASGSGSDFDDSGSKDSDTGNPIKTGAMAGKTDPVPEIKPVAPPEATSTVDGTMMGIIKAYQGGDVSMLQSALQQYLVKFGLPQLKSDLQEARNRDLIGRRDSYRILRFANRLQEAIANDEEDGFSF